LGGYANKYKTNNHVGPSNGQRSLPSQGEVRPVPRKGGILGACHISNFNKPLFIARSIRLRAKIVVEYKTGCDQVIICVGGSQGQLPDKRIESMKARFGSVHQIGLNGNIYVYLISQ